VHAWAQAEELGIRRILVPKAAPAFSALGLLSADHLVDRTKGTMVASRDAGPAELERALGALENQATDELKRAGVAASRIRHQRFAQCRYAGQTWDIDVPVAGKIDAKAVARIADDFHRIHEAEHTYARREEDVLIAGVRVRSRGMLDKPKPPALKSSSKPPRAKGKRRAFFGRWHEASLYDGEGLLAGQTIKGPAIVEEPFTTIVVPPGWRLKLDAHGNYVATRSA
jgi:N-methylhydantoinase A